jgi:hypothetical protein
MRTYAPSSAILAPEIPMHLLGRMRPSPSILRPHQNVVNAPRIPLHQLGWLGAGASGSTVALEAGAAVGSKVAAGAVTSAATSAGWGAAAGPIGAAVAVAIGVIVSLIAAHEQRLKDAKNENEAAANCVSSFYSIIQQIMSAYNSGQIAASDAISQLQNLDQATYSGLRSKVGTPGTAWNSSSPGVCNKSCTVGCCLYNTYLHPQLFGGPGGKVVGLIQLLQAGGGTWTGGGIPTNSYGFPSQASFTITVNPPSSSAGISSALTSLTGGGSLLPLVLLAVGAYLVMQ